MTIAYIIELVVLTAQSSQLTQISDEVKVVDIIIWDVEYLEPFQRW